MNKTPNFQRLCLSATFGDMRKLAVSAVALWVVAGICQTGTGYVRDFERFAARVNEHLAGGGWEMTTNRCCSIILVRRNVRLLFDYNLGLPDTTDEEKWDKHSIESDYTFRIDFDTELSQEEYDLLRTTKVKLVAGRVKGLNPQTVAYVKAKAIAENLLRIPQYHWNGRSVYISCPYDSGWKVRPTSVADQRAKVMALLDRTFTRYQASKSEPAGGANRSQPISSETNSASATAGSGRSP